MTGSPGPSSGYHPWTTYIAACEEARRRGDRRVGTDHLVLGLLADPEMAAVVGVTRETARLELDALDDQALHAVGVDAAEYDAPPLTTRALPARPTFAAVLKHRILMTPGAKAALHEAGRPIRRRQRITAGHVLAALLENRPPDPAATLLASLGVDIAEVRRRLAALPAA